MNPARVLHILGSAEEEGKGIVQIVSTLASLINPEQFQIHACFLRGRGPLAEQLLTQGIPVRTMRWTAGVRDPLGGVHFWQFLRRGGFQLIHQHYGGRSVRWLARHATRAPLIVSIHGEILESRPHDSVAFDLRDANAVIANSQAVARHVKGVIPQVIYPGLLISETPGERRAGDAGCESMVLGTAGRLIPIKGLSFLLRAMVALKAEFPGLRLEIAGCGAERTKLEAESRNLGLDNCVRFLGWVADLRSVYQRWDVFVQPSIEEGFGIAILQAMGAGLPIVATRIGGIPELLRDRESGLLVPAQNAEELAKAIRSLLMDPSIRRTMGFAAHRRARQFFSARQMVGATSVLYARELAPERTDIQKIGLSPSGPPEGNSSE